ncbi:MAG: 8-oxo-dGTP diphosphatase [Xanthomonadales bacterium]|nr:8-oxo-dGTP diphosphatase [Xanthomonadales bacterium]
MKLSQIAWDDWQADDLATLVFIIHAGRILLIRKKRGLGAGKINGPGGKLDPGETPEACAIRECEEEIGVTPVDLEYCGENLFQFTDGYGIHVHVYRAFEFLGEPHETDEAIPMWYALDAIPYDEMWADDELWVPAVLSGQTFVGRWIFDGDDYLEYELDIDH